MKVKSFVYGAIVFGLGVNLGWAIKSDLVAGLEKSLKESEQHWRDAYKTQRVMVSDLRKTLWSERDAAESAKTEETEATLVQPTGEIEVPESVEESNAEEWVETPEEHQLRRLIDSYTNDDDNSARFVEAAKKEHDMSHKAPFVISQAEFAGGEEGEDYEKVTLTYYENDRVMLDEDENTLQDVGHIVGWRNLREFGGQSGHQDVVFVRNHKMMTDFEIERQDPDSELPIHIRYGLEKEEYDMRRHAGLIKFRGDDE